MYPCTLSVNTHTIHALSRPYLQSASRATLIFWKLPSMCILVSASTMRVLVAFSIVYLVLPLCIQQRQREGACDMVREAG
jgi:hypothetical protein